MPRRYRCQPVKGEDALRVKPQFTSLRYGDPGYGYAEPYAYDAGPTYYGSYGYQNWGYGPCYREEGYRRVSCDGPAR